MTDRIRKASAALGRGFRALEAALGELLAPAPAPVPVPVPVPVRGRRG